MDLLDLADNPIPSGCRLEMISTSDGVRLRTARWPALHGGAKGTVCLFPGWSETIEKYFHVVERLRQRHAHCAAASRHRAGDHERDRGHRLQHHRRPLS